MDPTAKSEIDTPADVASSGADPVRIRELVLACYEDVYRFAFRLAGSQADAEDLTQQTFLIAHRKLHQLRQESKSKSWLLAIVRSCFLKSCRRAGPITGLELAVDQIPAREAGDSGFDEEQLRAAIADLPDEFKIVLLMFYFEDLSYREIAEKLDVPPGTVMSRLSRAKGRLRHRLLAAQSDSGSPPDREGGSGGTKMPIHTDLERDRTGSLRSQR